MPSKPHPLALLLEELDRGDFRISLDGEHLKVSPSRLLTQSLREGIQRFRAEVLELARLFGPAGLLALFSGRTLSEAERSLLADKALELRDRLPQTENQCGQCSAWRPSCLVELRYSERIYLCAECLADHPETGAALVGSAVAI